MKHRETGWCVWAANKAVNTPNVRDAQSTESCSAHEHFLVVLS